MTIDEMRQLNLQREREFVELLRQDWLNERDRLTRMVADCATAKTTPPGNYWEKAHRAEKRFLMALNVLTVLEGIV